MLENPTRRSRHRIGLLVTFLLLVSVLVTAADTPASGTVPGANGKIAYVKAGATDAIWTMDADGGNQTALTLPGAGNQYEPAWSPDGTKLAFRLDPFAPGIRDEIVVLIFGGSTLVNLTDTAGVDEFEPAWSPDGTKIAYTRSGTIWTMNADGSNQAALISPSAFTGHSEPAWSPDGTKIAYRRLSATDTDDVYVVNADGTGPVNLTDTIGIDESDPTWSPDGTRIAYTRNHAIWTMNADGSGQAALAYVSTPADVESVWSPDGTKIAYRHDFPASDDDDIFARNADGTGTVNLTGTAGVSEFDPAWQPLNRPPVAVDDTYSVAMNVGRMMWPPGVLGNDIDLDGDSLTVVDPSSVVAANGTLTMTADGSFAYIPDTGFTGPDIITYRATDGTAMSNVATVTFEVIAIPQVGLVDPLTGEWHLGNRTGVLTTFYYGNPGDYPFVGDWDGDGIDTPGLYRQSDGFAYLRNSNTQGVADVTFFFGDPGDVPLAGDFDGDGYDTLSIYRPSEARFYIINELGEDGGGLGAADYSFLFGDAGDKPVVGDWDGDGVDEIGLHRESSGFFYYRNTLTTGIADGQFYFGDPGDRFVAGDWENFDGIETPALFRPSDLTFYFRYTLTPGNADFEYTWADAGTSWLPVAGVFGLMTPA